MENLMYKDWKAENEAKIGMRFGEVKSSGLEHVELPLELSSGSTTTRQSSLVNGGEEAKDAEEEEEEVQQVSERAPTLPSRTTSAPRIRVTPQQRQGLHVPAAEEEGRGKRRIQAPNRLTYDALGKPAKSALAGAALMVGEDEESDYDECAFVFFSPVEMPGEPATLKEALESSDAEEWKKAMESELKSIEENSTWELVELPKGRKAITSKWLFKIKSDADGKIERYKSRLAPRQWYLKLRGVLEEIGFTPSTADHSLFMLGEGEQRSFMVVYVDDILIFSPSSDLVKEVMLKLEDKFKCKALGDVSFYLGLHIERDVEKRCMRVHQRKYLEALAANFGQSEGHVATPFPSGFKCVKGPEEESVGEEERRRFHSLVGSLMYAAVNTRPDVAFATGQLARVVQCPTEEQVAAGMMVAKYLGQTPTVGLQYSAAAQRRQKGADGVEPGRLFLTAFSDASFASEPEDMTSVGGFRLRCCADGDCYRCVPPEPGIAAAALGASESSTLPCPAPSQALHTFTLDSGASACFFHDSTTLTPLSTLSSRVRRLASEPPQVDVSARVSATGQVAASCLCRLLSHQTLLWHHRLGHPSLPRLRGMHTRLLVSGLSRSLPPLPPSPAPHCLPCVEERQRAAPPSSSFPPTTAPPQTFHMDVWGPARVSGQSHERYFLQVFDDFTRYTTVFPLRSKGQVVDVLIPWIRTVRFQLRECFGQDLPVLRLHSDRGGEFPSNLFRDFCCGEGILQSFTLPDSPQRNSIAERRIGLVMEVARNSMIHAAAPHVLWPFAVRYAAHQLNFWPRISLPETSPTLRWTGEVGDALVFTSPPRAVSSLLRTSRWTKFAPSGVSQVDPLPGLARVPVVVGSGAARGSASGGAASWGAEPGGAESEGAENGGVEHGGVETGGAKPGGAEPEGAEPGGAASEGAESGDTEPQGAASSGDSAGASLKLSPQQLREWIVGRARLRSGAIGAGGAGATGAGVTGSTAATGPGGARTRGTGACGAGCVEGAVAGDPTESGATGTGDSGAGGAAAGGAGVGGTGEGDIAVGGPGVGGAGAVAPGGAVRPRPYFVPLLQQVLGTLAPPGLTPPLLCPPPDKSQPPLQPASPLSI
ncbi:unnamed protein product [Closterium sp. NIES-54]